MAAALARVRTQKPASGRRFDECPASDPDANLPAMKHEFADEDLRLTRDRLLIRSAELEDRLTRVRKDLGRQNEPLPKDFSDAAIAMENDEILAAIEKSTVEELDRIHLALERLEAGTFPICEKCGQEIGAERLRAVPYATRCRRCEPD